MTALSLLLACSTHGHPPHRPDVGVAEVRPSPSAPPVPSVTTAVTNDIAGGCTPPPPPTTATGWMLEGYHPGPALTDVVAIGHHHPVMMATTRTRVCASTDEGARWTQAIDGALDNPTLLPLPALHAAVMVAQGTVDEPTPARVYVTHEDEATWVALVLPTEAGTRARVVTDGVGRVYVASDTKLWMSVDARTFTAPRSLPGSTADGFAACGDTLVARAHQGADGFWHHSVDHGGSWRPFRLGMIGLEGSNALVRCAGWHGGVEVGRAPLPAHWTFDQGRTWLPSRYDLTARTQARSSGDGESPHCASGPSGELVCMDAGRLVLPDARENGYEIHAPAACEHVRMVDDGRVVAFGSGCGIFVSADRGGLWKAVTTSFEVGRPRAGAVGRGGFVNTDTAWRVDGGVWWTHDAGQHWHLVPAVNGRTLERGVFVDDARGVFARGDGWVVSTQDGGRTWGFVMRGDIERIASAGPWVMVTTSERVRVSSDGGAMWRPSGTIPADRAVDPSLELVGTQRRFTPTTGARVEQQGDRIVLSAHGEDTELVHGLGRGYDLLAAHATGTTVDRVLLAGGGVLARVPTETARAVRRHAER